ncbi:MAG: hypothetical protein KJO33_03890, partial [Gammaproteobacteria bacterium]|nr:hypothetical protein [Gammaproteobacteria bacterium]
MGRASRRKRERAEAAEPAAAANPRTRKPYVFLGAVLAAALVLAWGAWQFVRESSPPAPKALVLPDPDRSAMTAPVGRAISQARAAALASPDVASAVGHYCQVLHAHWLHEEAADCYDVARRLAPRDFRWFYLLAGVEEVLGADGERVLGLFRDAIGLAPHFPPLQIRYGDALL